MTVLLSCIICAASVLVSVFLGDLGGASSARMRAQASADAAALAAVAEGAPYGDSDPRSAAETYATANGGDLVSCDCDPLSDRVEVVVEVDGVRATASAEIDAELFGALALPDTVRGLDPRLATSVKKIIAASDGAVSLRDGFRTLEEQKILWADALEKYGDPEIADDWVARPGHSFHETGLAVDLDGDVELAARLVGGLGLPLWRPMWWEPWHFELEGSRG